MDGCDGLARRFPWAARDGLSHWVALGRWASLSHWLPVGAWAGGSVGGSMGDGMEGAVGGTLEGRNFRAPLAGEVACAHGFLPGLPVPLRGRRGQTAPASLWEISEGLRGKVGGFMPALRGARSRARRAPQPLKGSAG